MADMWEYSREERGWSPDFTRTFNDWELDEVHGFFFKLFKGRGSSLGRMICCFSKKLRMVVTQ